MSITLFLYHISKLICRVFMQYSRTCPGAHIASKVCNIFPEYRDDLYGNAKQQCMQTTGVAESTMSEDPELNAVIRGLYGDMLRGERNKQAAIDSYIYAELVLRDRAMADRLRKCSQRASIAELLRSRREHTIHRETLPDLGNFIRSIVFFSGDRPCEPHISNTPINCCIYEALPNIKRTKQVKHKLKCDKMDQEMQNTSAIISVLLGTLLALYPECAKIPSFASRCDIVAMLRQVQCLTQQEKLKFLDQIPSLMKLCFMEYVSWFIRSYMPVELEIIQKSATTPNFLRTCPNVCDMFRQEMIQMQTLNFAQIDKLAAQAIERCTRQCKFKMQRHVYTKDNTLHYPTTIDKASFQKSITLLQPSTYQRVIKRYKARMSAPLDTTKELHIFYASEKDHTSIMYASILQQQLQIVKLPENIGRQQLDTIYKHYGHCMLLQDAVRSFYVCATCVLQGRMQAPKFRMLLSSNTLQCNLCKNDYSVFKIDMVGVVVYFAGKAIVMCPQCGNTTMNHGTGTTLSGGCLSCRKNTKADAAQPAVRKVCFVCHSHSVFASLRLLNSEHMHFEQVLLCSKHYPSEKMQRYIHDISQL